MAFDILRSSVDIDDLHFEKNAFCNVCLKSTIDDVEYYASKDILTRNSKFFRALLNSSLEEDIVVQLNYPSQTIKTVLIFFYKNFIKIEAKWREDIHDLITISHELIAEELFGLLLEYYKSNFDSYGLIWIDDLRNIPSAFNDHPEIRDLFFKKFIKNIKDGILKAPNYKMIEKDLLVEIISYDIKHYYDPNSKITDTKGRSIFLAYDMENQLHLGAINKNEKVHFYCWNDEWDEDILDKNIIPLWNNGKFLDPKKKDWTEDTPNMILDHFYYMLSKRDIYDEDDLGYAINDLEILPPLFKNHPSYREAIDKLRIKIIKCSRED